MTVLGSELALVGLGLGAAIADWNCMANPLPMGRPRSIVSLLGVGGLDLFEQDNDLIKAATGLGVVVRMTPTGPSTTAGMSRLTWVQLPPVITMASLPFSEVLASPPSSWIILGL